MSNVIVDALDKYNSMVVLAKRARPEPRTQSPSSLLGGSYSGDSRETQRAKHSYALNTGWTFAAIRPIAVRCARQPFRVGRVVRKDDKKAVVKSTLPDFLKGQLSEEMSVDVLESHPLLSIMADPNEFMTEWCLKYVTAFSVQLTNRAFWLLVKSNRTPSGIDVWPVPSHWVTPDNSRGFRKYWKITPYGSTESYTVSADEMVYFYYPDPSDPFSSRGPMDAARPASETSEKIREAQRTTFDNLAMPTVIFHTGLVPGEDGSMQKPELSKDQKEQIEFGLRQAYRGVGKWGRMMVTDRVIDKVELLSSKPIEMDFPESGKMTKDEIMQIFGVNPIVAGQIEDANRASATVANEGFLDNVVNPLLTLMSQVINQWMMPFIRTKNENIIVWIEEARVIDPDGRRNDLELLAKWGGVMVDEMRMELGKPPLPNGKGQVIIRPLNVFMEPIDGDGPELDENPQYGDLQDADAEE